MTLSRSDQAQLRALADDLRIENPRLARVLLRRGITDGLRMAIAVLAIIGSVVLLALGSPASCACAVALDGVAAMILRTTRHPG